MLGKIQISSHQLRSYTSHVFDKIQYVDSRKAGQIFCVHYDLPLTSIYYTWLLLRLNYLLLRTHIYSRRFQPFVTTFQSLGLLWLSCSSVLAEEDHGLKHPDTVLKSTSTCMPTNCKCKRKQWALVTHSCGYHYKILLSWNGNPDWCSEGFFLLFWLKE